MSSLATGDAQLTARLRRGSTTSTSAATASEKLPTVTLRPKMSTMDPAANVVSGPMAT